MYSLMARALIRLRRDMDHLFQTNLKKRGVKEVYMQLTERLYMEGNGQVRACCDSPGVRLWAAVCLLRPGPPGFRGTPVPVARRLEVRGCTVVGSTPTPSPLQYRASAVASLTC